MNLDKGFPETRDGDVISLDVYPGLETRSTKVAGIRYDFPEPASVIDVAHVIAEHLSTKNDPRAGECIGAFQAVAQALTGAAARLETAAKCELNGETEKMNEHIAIAKERLMQAGQLVEATKKFTESLPKQVE